MHLADWISWIKSLHVKQIDLGLTRVKEVAKRLGLLELGCPVVIVGGTNGKGSTVAALEGIYSEAGYRTGIFTSPFLFRFNEQIRLLSLAVEDDILCQAFAKIELARKDISLTPFEFTTLAALEIFKQAHLDICILEVGLGGRLDAVNIIDADVSIVTSIDIDHADWLGDTREKIAVEKAGIFRAGKPAICGDLNPPHTLIDYAATIGANLYCQNKQFGFDVNDSSWNWWSEKNKFENLPLSKLYIQNLATVLMAVELLPFAIDENIIKNVLKKINLPGRIQVIEGDVTHIYDVSHNPAAVNLLTNYLRNTPCSGKTYAVFSMLADKDISSTINVIKNLIDGWHIAPLAGERAASKELLMQKFQDIDAAKFYSTINDAYQTAKNHANNGDRIVIFGSFHTIAELKNGFGNFE